MDSKPDHGKGSEGSNLMSASLVNWKVSQLVFCTLLAIWSLTAVAEVKTPDSPKRYMFDLPQQSVADSLNDIATQSGAQFLFPFQLAQSKTAKPITGHFTLLEATAQLLQNSGLKSDLVDGVLTISPVDDAGTSSNQNHKGKNMNTNARKTVLASMVGLFAAGGMATATAQDSVGESARAQGVLDEIIVTSTRRAESLNDAALSVAAIDGEEISKRNLSEMNDYLRTLPGVNFVDLGVGRNAVMVRGIAIDPQLGGAGSGPSGPTVGIYFGEVSLAGLGVWSGNADLKMVDLERVEVLRGPQGTLFGSGSLAGAVRNIPASPELNEISGDMKASFSNTGENGDNNTKLEGVLNIPVIEDVLAIRAVAYRHDSSGYINNIAATQLASDGPITDGYTATEAVAAFGGADLYQDETDVGSAVYTGGRISALWQAADNLSFTLQYVTQDVEQEGLPYVQTNLGAYEQVSLQFGDALPGQSEGLTNEISITNLVARYDLGGATLLSSSAWLKDKSARDWEISALLGGSPAAQWRPEDQVTDAFTQELRLVSELEGPFQYVLGVYYEDIETVESLDTYATGDLASNLFGLGPFGDTNPLLNTSDTDRSIEQISVYGEVSYDVNDQLTVTAGGRHFDYERHHTIFEEGVFGGLDQSTAIEEDGTNLKLNLSYQLDGDMLIYAQWTEGFRLGNSLAPPSSALCDVNNDGILDGTITPITNGFRSDGVENFELGAKLTLLENRLQVNTSIFRMDWNDIPITVIPGKLPEQDEPTCFSGVKANAGEAQSEGIEIEATFQVTDSFKLSLGGSHTNSELTSVDPGVSFSVGDRLPSSPEYNLNIGMEYQFTLSNNPSYISTRYARVGEYFNGVGETGSAAGDYGQLDLSVGITIDKFNVELFANNLANSDAIVHVDRAFLPRAYRLRPRTLGLSVGYQF
ncbi:TonB-dependent receptor [SAR92 clade bacterium H246]